MDPLQKENLETRLRTLRNAARFLVDECGDWPLTDNSMRPILEAAGAVHRLLRDYRLPEAEGRVIDQSTGGDIEYRGETE